MERTGAPIYASGPDDDVHAIAKRLASVVGPDGYDFVHPFTAYEVEDEADELGQPLVSSPLGRDTGAASE